MPDSVKSKEASQNVAGEDYNTLVTEISSKLEQVGISINEAPDHLPDRQLAHIQVNIL